MQTNAVREVLNTDMKAVRGDKLSWNHKITFLILSDTTTQSLFEIYTAVTLTVSTTADILSDGCRAGAKTAKAAGEDPWCLLAFKETRGFGVSFLVSWLAI